MSGRPLPSRRASARRLVALWLLVAQFLLFVVGASGHRHDGPVSPLAAITAGEIASLPLLGSVESDAPAAPGDCSLCDAARGAAARLDPVSSFRATPLACGAVALASAPFVAIHPATPHSPRAPPIG